MKSKCNPFMWGIVGLASASLIFHLIGFITPGWLIMKRTINEPPRHIGGNFVDNDIFGRGELKDTDSDEKFPKQKREAGYPHSSESDSSEESSEHRGGHHSGHHGGHHGGHHPPPPHHGPHGPHGHGRGSHSEESSSVSDMEHEMWERMEGRKEWMEEKESVINWMRMKKDEMGGADIQTNYGLWHSRVCMSPSERKMRPKREDHSKDMDKDYKKDGHKEVYCKKISTQCALHYSYIYESREHFSKSKRTIDNKKFAFASLLEHRLEACLGLAFIALGLVTAAFGFRDILRYRYVVYASILFMLLAASLTAVPVSRFARYSAHKHHEKFPVYVHVPYSVVTSAMSAFFAICCALISMAVVCMTSRKSQKANWRHLENEQIKKPQLVFYNDTLPAKPGLYDVCDFSNIKPVEEKTMENENTE